MENQIILINLVPSLSTPAVVRVSQYDVGRPLVFKVYDGTSPADLTGVTAVIEGTKKSGLGFSESGTVSDNTVTLNTTLAMTQEDGSIPAEIRFSKTGEDVGTANFILAVEKSPHEDGTTDGTQETMANLETRLQGQIDALDSRIDAIEGDQSIIDDIDALDERVTALEHGGGGLTEAVKSAMLQVAQKVAYIDEHGQTYYDALYNALYPPAELVSISSVYTQSGTVYDTDTLDSLKPDLVVTAYYDNQTSAVVTNYTLSGTLEEGTSTITVSYGGKTATFDVTVTHYVWNASLNIENDFVAGTAVSNSYNANYNGYYTANSGRCANCEFGILLEAGYKYTFSFNTTANGKNFGIQTYKATCLTAFENHSSIRDYYNADSGWQSISYQFTPTEDMVFQVQCSVTKASLATSGITDLIISREVV